MKSKEAKLSDETKEVIRNIKSFSAAGISDFYDGDIMAKVTDEIINDMKSQCIDSLFFDKKSVEKRVLHSDSVGAYPNYTIQLMKDDDSFNLCFYYQKSPLVFGYIPVSQEQYNEVKLQKKVNIPALESQFEKVINHFSMVYSHIPQEKSSDPVLRVKKEEIKGELSEMVHSIYNGLRTSFKWNKTCSYSFKNEKGAGTISFDENEKSMVLTPGPLYATSLLIELSELDYTLMKGDHDHDVGRTNK